MRAAPDPRLAVVTFNSTSARALKEYLLAAQAPIVCTQELRIAGDDADDLGRWAARRGWDPFLAEATAGPGGGLSGGVAIFCRSGRAALADARCVVPGRAVTARVTVGDSPAITVCSAYLVTGGRLCDHNRQILGSIASDVEDRGCPFVIAADFNCAPEVIGASAYPSRLRAEVLAPAGPFGTCASGEGGRSCSVLDYFIVSEGLALTAEGVHVDCTWPANRHRPVQLTLRAAFGDIQVLKFERRARIPVNAPFGPQRRLPSASAAAAACCTAALEAGRQPGRPSSISAALTAAYATFGVTAATELSAATDTILTVPQLRAFGRAPRLEWVDALPLDERPAPAALASARGLKVAALYFAHLARHAARGARSGAAGCGSPLACILGE